MTELLSFSFDAVEHMLGANIAAPGRMQNTLNACIAKYHLAYYAYIYFFCAPRGELYSME